MSAAKLTAAQNTVIRLRSLVTVHTEGAADAKRQGWKRSEEAHQEYADHFARALEILIEEMGYAKEEVPQ